MESTAADAHVLAAIAAYREDREAAVRTVKVCDDKIAALEAILTASGTVPEAAPTRRPSAGGPSVRDVAIQLAGERGTFTLSDLGAALKEAGNESAYASVSSLMSRLVRDGILARVEGQRATFRLAPKNTEGPTATAGPSVGTNGSAGETAGPDEHEGGDSHETRNAHSGDQGGEDLDHHHHRASVGG